MVGRRYFPFGIRYIFRGELSNFQGCKILMLKLSGYLLGSCLKLEGCVCVCVKNHFRKRIHKCESNGPQAQVVAKFGIRGWSPGNSSNKKPKRHTLVPAPPLPIYPSRHWAYEMSLGLWNVRTKWWKMLRMSGSSLIFHLSNHFWYTPENQHSWLEKGPCMKIHFLHNMGIFRPAMLVSGRNYISPSPRLEELHPGKIQEPKVMEVW